VKEETLMKKLLVALSLGLLLAVPLVALAAGGGSTRGDLPPAVDQMLAKDMVQLAQSQLKVAGFDPGHVDGIFDQQTVAALRKYQAANQLPVTGLLDESTRRELFPGSDNPSED
jgi:peptidoglycan hydrolase-like protein with peptidoglycan-binding domain